MSAQWLTEEPTGTKVFHLIEPLQAPAGTGAENRHKKRMLLKKRAAHIRWKGINFADKYLIEFESNFSRRGGKIHWAFNEREWIDDLKLIVKKEKLNLNVSLFSAQDPSPYLKINKNENGKQAWLLNASFLIADPGGVSVNMPKGFRLPANDELIVVAAVDKVLPSLTNLETLLPLQQEFNPEESSKVMNLFFGQSAGGRAVHVIITENNTAEMMAVKSHRSLLHCIDCRQCCLNSTDRKLSDEIKKQVLDRSGEILTDSFSFPLDGKQAASCPVMINFDRLILLNRQNAVNRNYVPGSEKWFYFFWTKAAARKSKIPVPGRSLDFYVNSLFNKSESKLREPLLPARKPFSKLWKENIG